MSSREDANPMTGSGKRTAIMVYAVAAYAVAMASLVYAIGFIGNLVVPRSIDIGPQVSVATAIAIDVALLALFAVQHSGMARGGFKRMLTRTVPEAAERSTYVLVSGLLLWALFWLWRPIAGDVWNLAGTVWGTLLLAVYLIGWVVVVGTTFLINHFDLFGLRQAVGAWRDKRPSPLAFRTPFLYRIVRHPLYFGFLLVLWAAPVMTWGHLLFSVLTTGYILIGATLEERDLVAAFGQSYRDYRARVPMLLPWRRARRDAHPAKDPMPGA